MSITNKRLSCFLHCYKSKVLRKITVWFFAFFVLFLVVRYIFPFFCPLRLTYLPPSIILLDRNNVEIGEIPYESSGITIRHRPFSYEDIPPFLKIAIVAIEDRRFWSHGGVDVVGILRAIKENIRALSLVQGASTIPAQLVRNMLRLNKPRTFFTKLAEFWYARVLSVHHTKEEILTAYANRLYFGYLTYGFESAAQWYFGKPLQQLTKAEQLALLVLPKNPKKYDPHKNKQGACAFQSSFLTGQTSWRRYVPARQQSDSAFCSRFFTLATYLYKNGYITSGEYLQIMSENLLFQKGYKQKLPYIVDLVKKLQAIEREKHKKKDSIVGSSLNYAFSDFPFFKTPTGAKNVLKLSVDAHLSAAIDKIARQTIVELQRKNVTDYGILVVDRQTRAIRVLLGGISYDSTKGGQVNTVFAKNQPGSAVKPFTYVLAFKKLGLTPDTTILDAPVQYQTAFGYAYAPKNFNLTYQGEVTLGFALANSLNVPAVKLAYQIGPGYLLDFYHKVGFVSLRKSPEYYGVALTLGVGEVSLYELVRAYGLFAYGGKVCDFTLQDLDSYETGGKQTFPLDSLCLHVIEKNYTDMIEAILSDRNLRSYSFPLGGNLDFGDMFVVLKSGTSRHFSDNWVIGYTKKYLLGVWVGNKDGSYMKGVSGAAGAGDIFKKIVMALESTGGEDVGTSSTFTNTPTKGILQNKQTASSGFLEITAPLPKSVYKIDKLIPLERQQIKFQFVTTLPYERVKWEVKKRKTAKDQQDHTYFSHQPSFFWQLQPGVWDAYVTIFSSTHGTYQATTTFEVKDR